MTALKANLLAVMAIFNPKAGEPIIIATNAMSEEYQLKISFTSESEYSTEYHAIPIYVQFLDKG